MRKNMNKNVKKITALLCAMLFMAGGTGCSTNEVTPSSASAEVSPTDGTEPFPITILTQTYSDSAADDNRLLMEIEERTNTELDLTFAPAASYTEKFVMTIASGEMPMLLLITDPKHSTYIDALKHGAFWDLTPYLADYPQLSTLGDAMWENARYDGANYMVPRYRPIARNGILYRKDWADAAGLDEPATVEELYEMIQVFSAGDFDKNGKIDSIGMALDTNFYQPNTYIASLFGAPTHWGVNEEGNIVPMLGEPEYLDALNWYRALYEEKAINQDFAVLQESKTLFAKGNVGVWGTTCDDVRATEVLNDLPVNAPGAEVGVLYQLSGPAGTRNAAASSGFYGGFAIPKNSVNDEKTLRQVLGFLDTMAGPDVANLLTYGQEGTDYTLDGDTVIQTEDQKAEFSSVLGGLGQLMVNNYSNLYQPSIEIDKLCYEMWDQLEETVVLDPTASLNSDTWGQKSADLTNIASDAAVKYVMKAIDEDGFRAEVERWYDAGGDKVCEEFTEEYKKSTP